MSTQANNLTDCDKISQRILTTSKINLSVDKVVSSIVNFM